MRITQAKREGVEEIEAHPETITNLLHTEDWKKDGSYWVNGVRVFATGTKDTILDREDQATANVLHGTKTTIEGRT